MTPIYICFLLLVFEICRCDKELPDTGQLGSLCSTDFDCDLPFVCISRECQCPTGYSSDKNKDECIEAPDFNEACHTGILCKKPYVCNGEFCDCPTNSTRTNSGCKSECSPSEILMKNQCLQKIPLDGECKNSIQCQPGAQCTGGTCQCMSITTRVVDICQPKESESHQLTDYLLNKSATVLRTINENETMIVYVRGSLNQIVEIDQRRNLVTLSLTFDMWWFDPMMSWNSSLFNDTLESYIPSTSIWVPDLYLYQSTSGSTAIELEGDAIHVTHEGRMRISVPFTAKAFCGINVKYFPFDRQSCSFMFGSWSYQDDRLIFQPADEEMRLTWFFDNQEWVLQSTRLRQSIRTGEHDIKDKFSVFIVDIRIKREAFYYLFSLIFPAVVVVFTAIIGLHVPVVASGPRQAKFQLGIVTLLPMGLLLLTVSQDMPKYSYKSVPGQRGSFSDVPLLAIFYLLLICLVSAATCTSSLTVVLEKIFRESGHGQKVRRKPAFSPGSYTRRDSRASIGIINNSQGEPDLILQNVPKISDASSQTRLRVKHANGTVLESHDSGIATDGAPSDDGSQSMNVTAYHKERDH